MVWWGGIAARAGPSSLMSFAHKWTRSIHRSCPPFRLATRSCGKLPAIWIHQATRSSASAATLEMRDRAARSGRPPERTKASASRRVGIEHRFGFDHSPERLDEFRSAAPGCEAATDAQRGSRSRRFRKISDRIRTARKRRSSGACEKRAQPDNALHLHAPNGVTSLAPQDVRQCRGFRSPLP